MYEVEADIWNTDAAIVEMGNKIRELDILAIQEVINRIGALVQRLKGIGSFHEAYGVRANDERSDTMKENLAYRRRAAQGQIDSNNQMIE